METSVIYVSNIYREASSRVLQDVRCCCRLENVLQTSPIRFYRSIFVKRAAIWQQSSPTSSSNFIGGKRYWTYRPMP